MLSHKMNLKFKKIEVLKRIFSGYCGMKQEIIHKKKTGKITDVWGLNNMQPNNQWVIEKIKGEILKMP